MADYDWDDDDDSYHLENEETSALVWDAIAALRQGRHTDALTILERTAQPKWWKSARAAEQYAEAKAEAAERADVAFRHRTAELASKDGPEPKEWR